MEIGDGEREIKSSAHTLALALALTVSERRPIVAARPGEQPVWRVYLRGEPRLHRRTQCSVRGDRFVDTPRI
jgi:hypothetical protein